VKAGAGSGDDSSTAAEAHSEFPVPMGVTALAMEEEGEGLKLSILSQVVLAIIAELWPSAVIDVLVVEEGAWWVCKIDGSLANCVPMTAQG